MKEWDRGGGRDADEAQPMDAGALSFVLPGAGQVYAGRIWRGLGMLAAWSLLALLKRPVFVATQNFAVVDAIILVRTGIGIWSAYDAWELTRRVPPAGLPAN